MNEEQRRDELVSREWISQGRTSQGTVDGDALDWQPVSGEKPGEARLEPLVRLLEAHETEDPERVAQLYARWQAAGEENLTALKVLAHRPKTLELYVKLIGRCFSGEVIEARLAEMIRLRGAQVATCAT